MLYQLLKAKAFKKDSRMQMQMSKTFSQILDQVLKNNTTS